MSQLLLAVVAGVRDISSTFPQKHNWHTHWSGSLLTLTKLFDTPHCLLVSSLNPLRCKAARRSLKQRVLGNCAVMSTLQQDTLERVFYLLLKSEMGERAQREALADRTEARPFTTDIWMTQCWSVIRSWPARTTDSSGFILTHAARSIWEA